MSDNEANPRQDLDFSSPSRAPNQVTGVQAVRGTEAYNLHVASNATFAVATNTVTETVAGTDSTKVITYTQDAGSTTLYDKSDPPRSVAETR